MRLSVRSALVTASLGSCFPDELNGKRELGRRDLAALGVPLETLWLTYISVGGSVPLDEFERCLRGEMVLDAHELDCLRCAVSEHPHATGVRAGETGSAQTETD